MEVMTYPLFKQPNDTSASTVALLIAFSQTKLQVSVIRKKKVHYNLSSFGNRISHFAGYIHWTGHAKFLKHQFVEMCMHLVVARAVKMSSQNWQAQRYERHLEPVAVPSTQLYTPQHRFQLRRAVVHEKMSLKSALDKRAQKLSLKQ